MNLPYYHKTSLAILLAATTLACGKGNDDTGSTTTDTGPTGTTQQFEEGCILVDGAGGYKWLDDALSLASEGSVITLCEGEILGSVELTGSLTIEGPGADLLLWTADVNHPAISISGGSDITLTGFEIASTRHGIEVADSTGVSIQEITFADI